MRTLCGVVLLAVIVAWPSASAGQELDPAFKADIEKLMEVTGAARIGEQMATLVSNQLVDMFRSQPGGVPERTAEIIRDLLESEFSQGLRGPDGMLARLVPLYAKHFTHGEVQGLLAFYATELGRKAVREMPALTQEGAAIGQQWAAEKMPRVLGELKARLAAEGLAPSPPRR
jgi:hypothetical protein